MAVIVVRIHLDSPRRTVRAACAGAQARGVECRLTADQAALKIPFRADGRGSIPFRSEMCFAGARCASAAFRGASRAFPAVAARSHFDHWFTPVVGNGARHTDPRSRPNEAPRPAMRHRPSDLLVCVAPCSGRTNQPPQARRWTGVEAPLASLGATGCTIDWSRLTIATGRCRHRGPV